MAWTGAVMLLVIGALMAVFSVKISRGTLHRNEWMGIRLPATQVSEEAWQAAHRRALPWFAATTVVAFVAGVGFLIAALVGADDSQTLPWFIAAFVIVAVLVLLPVPAAIRAAKAVAG